MTFWLNALRALRTLRAADRGRSGLPAEHWATFGAALSALGAARRIRSPAFRTLALVVGGVLALRAVTGRDGIFTAARRKARSHGWTGVRRP